MLNHGPQRVIVLDSKSAQPIGVRYVREEEDDAEYALLHDLSSDHHESFGEVPENSPDGLPAHPEFKPKALVLLMLSILGVVILAAVVVTLMWGLAAGALVFVFGSGLLFVGNPEVWATAQRARERDHSHDD